MSAVNFNKATVLIALFLITVFSVSCAEKTSPPDPAEKPTAAAPLENSPNTREDGQNRPLVTFIELGSVNCIPCRAMQPIMRDVEKEFGGQVKVVFYDVWKVEQAEYAAVYGIRAIPTQVFLDKDGKEYFRHEGYFPKEELVKVLKRQGVK